ncbi:hypothetical protein EDD37DRAFT_657945 [Exophiala viscosa]|uniref:uncharacterized protein n=1 Tax=Exophiala viscosa TaxID=2486360 RepID=UPI00219366A6|nr:hypothetical protein EDD37DRAFT_657945 [Exophiala viscosa]
MRVLVIGAGFGGLCLANGLARQKGIIVDVFERHADPSKELAGYGLRVGADGKRALQHCLDPESFKRFLAATTPAGSQWAFRDPQLRLLALRDDAKISGKAEADVERRAVHRFEFRDILLKGLTDPSVHWGKSFTHYEQLDNGRVRAHFADETSAEGDILIGADGSESKVREQRLPHLQREHLGIVIICGRYQLDDIRIQNLPTLMTDGSLNNIAYVVPKSQTPQDAKALTPEQLRDIALDGIKDWTTPLVTVVRDADLSTVAPIVLQSMPHLPVWESSNVTLLGDAIHNMTPMAGVGANIALRDAHVLTDLLIEAQHGNLDLLDVMWAYANDAVALSRGIAEDASSEGRLGRVAHASPMHMKATIGKNALAE